MSTNANIFNLSSPHLHVTYSTGGLGSRQNLVYQDAHQTLQFSGDQIRTISGDLGDLVSVTVHLTVDAGSTTFTLVVPKVELDLNQHAHVETIGVTALHPSRSSQH